MTEREGHIALFRYLDGIVICRLRKAERFHLVLAFEVKLVCRKLHITLVVKRCIGRYAGKHTLYIAVVLFDIVRIIGGDKLCTGIPCHTQKIWQYAFLLAYTVVLKLYIIILTEYILIFFDKAYSVRKSAVKQHPRKLSRKAGRKADKSVRIPS